jgi:hypothetical protein
MYVSPPRQVDRAHVRAAERERQLAALATAQVRPPPRYKYIHGRATNTCGSSAVARQARAAPNHSEWYTRANDRRRSAALRSATCAAGLLTAARSGACLYMIIRVRMQLRALEDAAAAEDTAARGGARRGERAAQTNTPNKQTNTRTDGSAQRSRRGGCAMRPSDGPCAWVMSACACACACACVSACVRVHQITGENVSICTQTFVAVFRVRPRYIVY